ncbi:MAG: M48 family metallopeptidase [Myxococcota bacterium]
MRWWLLGALIVASPACTQRDRVRAETKVADLLVSREQERDIGRQIHEELRQEGLTMLEDEVVVAYVEDMADRVAEEVKRQKGVADLHVHVVDDPEVVNAMATPGGHVYVFTGLLLEAEDEAEVAGVVAHEIAHVVARHSARQMVYAYGYQSIAALALGQNPSLLEQIGAQLAGTGFLAAHSRSEEEEADELGLGYLHRAGYDPRGLPRFFRKLKAQEGKTPAVMAWISTHPTTESRIENLRQRIRARGWEGGEVNAAKHARVEERLTRGRGTR